MEQVSSAVSKISNIAQRVRQNIVRELCNSKEKVSKEIDWKKVGIIAASTAAVLVLGYFTGGAGLVAAEALGLAKGSLGAMVFGRGGYGPERFFGKYDGPDRANQCFCAEESRRQL